MSKMTHLWPALLACAVLAPAPALAQTAAGIKIGVVNFARLIQESPQAKVTLKARGEKLQKDIQVMGAEERRSAESKFREEERDLGRRLNEFQEDFNVRRNEEISRLQRELLKEVTAFAKERGYDLIVGDGVLYADQNVDVTSQILAAIEAKGGAKP